MKKIAIISPMLLPVSLFYGGAVEQLILNIINENEKSNNPFEIDLYTIDSNNIEINYKYTNVYKFNKNKIKKVCQKLRNLIYKIFRSKKRYDYIINDVIKIVRNNVYEKVIIENRMGLYKEIYNKTNNKNNLIYHMHNDFDIGDKTENNYIFIEKTCYKILTVSNYIKERLLSVKYSSKIEVFYNCIDLNSFDNIDKQEISKLKENYKLNDNNYVIGFVGRVTSEKGVLELAKAFIKFKEMCKNSKLLIVGSSWFTKTNLTDFEKTLNDVTKSVKDDVIFTGYIDYSKIKYYYSLMNVLVIPSKCNEAFGLVGLEGMKMNLPIISTKNGALYEILGDNAIYISNDNMINDIYSSLEKTIELKGNKAIDLSQFSKEKYYENFSQFLN